MKREILCIKCKKEIQAILNRIKHYPGEQFKIIKGTAKKDFLCDGCINRTEIKKGDVCFALSIWTNKGGQPYYEWEGDYLNLIDSPGSGGGKLKT